MSSTEIIKTRWRAIEDRIARAVARAGRQREDVILVGASKQQAARAMSELMGLGVVHFGENYVQEWLTKREELGALGFSSDVHWHFIGALQSNKARKLVGEVEFIHSLDRMSLAQAIDRIAIEKGIRQRVLVEVNIGEESTKAGVLIADLEGFLNRCVHLKGLNLSGLMAMPPLGKDPRPFFRELGRVLRTHAPWLESAGHTWRHLSMGTSDDFDIAIEEGATMIRVGAALFGPRQG